MRSRWLLAAGVALSLASWLATSRLGVTIPWAAAPGALAGAAWGAFGGPMLLRAWPRAPWWLTTLIPPWAFSLSCFVILSHLGEGAAIVGGSSVAIVAWATLAELAATHWRAEKVRRRIRSRKPMHDERNARSRSKPRASR